MPGETDLHRKLKKEACRWMFRMGYRCIAAEVRLPPLGIIDAVGTGLFRAYQNYLTIPKEMHQVCFVECKASRSDFLSDVGEDGQLALCLGKKKNAFKVKRRRPPRFHLPSLGKFNSCLLEPMANLHYILAPMGIVQKKDLPPRWGLLSFSEAGVNVVVRAQWIESARVSYTESAIARTLTGDIYRADGRAMDSINREIFQQQQSLAERIRGMRPHIVLAPTPP